MSSMVDALRSYLPTVRVDREKLDPTINALKGFMADLSPGYGDVRAAERGSERFNAMIESLRQGEYLQGASQGAEGLTEHLSTVPVLGDVATMAKGASNIIAPALMTAWHGSPHKFDRFKMENIGTGEGAQAYGHGLYFAEDPKVAGIYQKALARENSPPPSTGAVQAAHTILGSPKYADEVESMMTKVYGKDLTKGEIKVAIEQAKAHRAAGKSSHLYEVDIPDEQIAKMLDWDAPLRGQSPAIKDVAAEVITKNTGITPDHPNYAALLKQTREQVDDSGVLGKGVYEMLAQQNMQGTKIGPGNEVASRVLNESGIPGIKYYDQASRSAGEGTRNLVLFDEGDVKILKRNNEALIDALRK